MPWDSSRGSDAGVTRRAGRAGHAHQVATMRGLYSLDAGGPSFLCIRGTYLTWYCTKSAG
jgi:hypothetical protein